MLSKRTTWPVACRCGTAFLPELTVGARQFLSGYSPIPPEVERERALQTRRPFRWADTHRVKPHSKYTFDPESWNRPTEKQSGVPLVGAETPRNVGLPQELVQRLREEAGPIQTAVVTPRAGGPLESGTSLPIALSSLQGGLDAMRTRCGREASLHDKTEAATQLCEVAAQIIAWCRRPQRDAPVIRALALLIDALPLIGSDTAVPNNRVTAGSAVDDKSLPAPRSASRPTFGEQISLIAKDVLPNAARPCGDPLRVEHREWLAVALWQLDHHSPPDARWRRIIEGWLADLLSLRPDVASAAPLATNSWGQDQLQWGSSMPPSLSAEYVAGRGQVHHSWRWLQTIERLTALPPAVPRQPRGALASGELVARLSRAVTNDTSRNLEGFAQTCRKIWDAQRLPRALGDSCVAEIDLRAAALAAAFLLRTTPARTARAERAAMAVAMVLEHASNAVLPGSALTVLAHALSRRSPPCLPAYRVTLLALQRMDRRVRLLSSGDRLRLLRALPLAFQSESQQDGGMRSAASFLSRAAAAECVAELLPENTSIVELLQVLCPVEAPCPLPVSASTWRALASAACTWQQQSQAAATTDGKTTRDTGTTAAVLRCVAGLKADRFPSAVGDVDARVAQVFAHR